MTSLETPSGGDRDGAGAAILVLIAIGLIGASIVTISVSSTLQGTSVPDERPTIDEDPSVPRPEARPQAAPAPQPARPKAEPAKPPVASPLGPIDICFERKAATANQQELDKLDGALAGRQRGRRVVAYLTSSASSIGLESLNKQLRERRAAGVKRALRERGVKTAVVDHRVEDVAVDGERVCNGRFVHVRFETHDIQGE